MKELPVDENIQPVEIKEEDLQKLESIRGLVETLNYNRQEIGRLYQTINNIVSITNQIEEQLSKERTALASEYGLDNHGKSQWGLDFEEKKFVKLSSKSPVVP